MCNEWILLNESQEKNDRLGLGVEPRSNLVSKNK